MTRQRVAYDFEYFSLDQPSDAPVTVLSLGRSLLKDGVGVTLPLRPTAPLGQSPSALPGDRFAGALCCALALRACHAEFFWGTGSVQPPQLASCCTAPSPPPCQLSLHRRPNTPPAPSPCS